MVFGAFAIVLVCLFALGLSAYRKMQRETAHANADAQEAQLLANQARAQADMLERRLQDTREEVSDAERRLALAYCRLAMHEIRDGNTARARTLLEEAIQLGAPPWAPLIERLTGDSTVRFATDDVEGAIIAGAISADQSVVAVARETPRGLVIEVYGAADGKLRTSYPPVAPGQTRPPACRLLLSQDGSAWYLPLPGGVYYGTGGLLTQPARLDAAETENCLSATANADLSVVLEARGAGGLVRRIRGPGGVWQSERIQIDLEDQRVDAVCLAGDKPVIATPSGIYNVGSDGRTGVLQMFDTQPERVALHYSAGAVIAAMLAGKVLDLAAIKLGSEPHIATGRHEVPDESPEDLRFLRDGTPVWVGRSGRVITMNFSRKREWTLGGYTLGFVERHPQGLVFGNRKGELSIRVQDEFRTIGSPVALVPPQFVAEPQAHGFILEGPGASRFALQAGRVQVLGDVTDVALAPQGAAFSSDALTLPGGLVVREEGVLLGAFADGSVLLFSQQKLKHVTVRGVSEFLLPGERVPDKTVLSAKASVAALRVGDNIYVGDMLSDLVQVASRVDVAPDLLALDATGLHLAVAYGPTIVVGGLHDARTLTIRSSAPPKKIALLFAGTVLVTLEGGELVFYEVDGGRELLRAGGSVSDVAASGDASLNLVSDSMLHSLLLTPEK